jgi:hypothetical protein
MTSWGAVELEPEVEAWLASLDDRDFGQAAFYLDLLESKGVLLDEPYTRQLDGKLRELRFYIGTTRQRISYYIVTGRRAILLTVFAKTAPRESREVGRARAAMLRCIEQGHTAAED